MAMKKTDLARNFAKKLDGRMKGAGVPDRFGQGALDVAAKREQRARDAATKLVPVAWRLPADLVNRLRERAVEHEGGINIFVAHALEEWLGSQKAA